MCGGALERSLSLVMSPIAIVLIIGATAGVIYLLVRREPAPQEPRSVPLTAVAQVVHGEPAMVVGEVAPDEGLSAVEAPFGGGEVLYHVTRLERVEDASPEEVKQAQAGGGGAQPAAPAPPMGGPGLGGLLGGLMGGGGAGGPAAGGAAGVALPPAGSQKGLVAQRYESPERWQLVDDTGVALIAPFVSEKLPSLRLTPECKRELRRVPLVEVEALVQAAGQDPKAILGLAAPSSPEEEGKEGAEPRLSDAYVIKQQLLRVGERVLLAGRGQQLAELGEPDEVDALRDAQRRERAVRALSGKQAGAEVLIRGDRQRELFVTNDDEQIASIARRALSER